ncbi:GNAT family N-acetyltransferase [Bacillus sp. FJAT-42376]|uniref:GNAT family N-acetyltransferase n=1 Tax=Bacillus sp. FJAT-42376 TaxID=2014076 RepID=UPI000F4FE39B|nr:GNAT family N-acetyltransferase [Bacillus sp. FJAT-42376]AZB42212.1 GNAT family N-acetyltransferase [Bacillus sp. FJAT-42376]
MFEIKPIQSSEAIPLRQQVISPDLPVEESKYTGDENKETIHIGAFAKEQLVGTASFYKEQHPELSGKSMYRLRGLAIDPEHRNELRGQTLILFGENLLAQHEIDVLWCTTKISNLPYYQHLGFRETGHTFNDGEKGLQVLMVKHI